MNSPQLKTTGCASRAGRADCGHLPRSRVLHLLTSFETGGTERQAVELLRRLDAQRFDVHLAVLRREGPLQCQIADRFPVVPEFRLTSFLSLNAVRQCWRLVRLLRRTRTDILHTHDFYAGLMGAVAGRLAGVRVITSQRHLRLSDRRSHLFGQRLMHSLAHRIVVNAAAIRDQLVKAGTAPLTRVALVRNGLLNESAVNRAAIRAQLLNELRLKDDALLIGSVARLQPVKGHRFLVEAFAQVADVHPHAHLVLIGDGQVKAEITEQVRRFGLADRVHLMGDRADAAQLIAGCDLSVLASLHEGLPNAVMEAMAAGVPVVATAVGGVNELVTEHRTGWLASPGDADSLFKAISAALSDEAQRALIAAQAREFITSQFSMQRAVSAVEKLYEEMLRERERELSQRILRSRDFIFRDFKWSAPDRTTPAGLTERW
ncbi:MAG: glycosyltransferase [Blastocatellia bacterium]